MTRSASGPEVLARPGQSVCETSICSTSEGLRERPVLRARRPVVRSLPRGQVTSPDHGIRTPGEMPHGTRCLNVMRGSEIETESAELVTAVVRDLVGPPRGHPDPIDAVAL